VIGTSGSGKSSLLRADDYSGMDEAVTQTANEALALLDGPARAELPALVAGLVADVTTDSQTGAVLPVVTALNRLAFESNPARAALVAAFVTKRLLTTEGPFVRPVHEALLRIWPAAVAIVAEVASLIRVRHTLAPLARGWVDAEAEEKAGHLELSPALLDGAQALLQRFGADCPRTCGTSSARHSPPMPRAATASGPSRSAAFAMRRPWPPPTAAPRAARWRAWLPRWR
jgi:hypothetical protein